MDTRRVRELWSGYWKVPVIAIVAALLAYAISFFFSATYEAQTSLLIRSASQSNLSTVSTAGSPSPVVNGTDLASALTDTQSALLNTTTVAADVVHSLHLMKHPVPSGGFFHKIKQGLKDLWDLFRYGKVPHEPLYQAEVANVYNSISSNEVTSSYVLQLDAKAGNPKLAAAIANAAANALVQVANQQFRSQSTQLASALDRELQAAARTDRNAAAALSSFETTHDVSVSMLSSGTASQRSSELSSVDATLHADEAKLQAAQSELTAIPETIPTDESIQTGRSTTEIVSQSPNPSYAQLESIIFNLTTAIAGLKEKQAGLQVSLDPPGTLTSNSGSSGLYAQLQQLYTASQTAASSYSTLSGQYQQAVVDAAATPVQLVRLDQAVPPAVPVSPDRALYALIGLLFGAAIGFILSHRTRQRFFAALADTGSVAHTQQIPTVRAGADED
ncbi:MAG TPA: Wzz/FepE/Etk N-terminal domain-containing protein [Acidimicrobiales bacterium]|nr:Wzz/FepE/Etk N-terminal domain-containing protein [Acidimicrobiales bacterium]